MNIYMKKMALVMINVLLLSACGGDGSTPLESEKIVLKNIENCSTNRFTSVKKDDKITALEEDTEVRITHSEDGTKQICILKGKAKIN